MRRGYEKVCMAAAVLAMSLSLSACGLEYMLLFIKNGTFYL